MNLNDIMEKDFITVTVDQDVLSIAKTLISKNKDYALVVDREGRLAGIITETDLIFQEKNVHIPTFFTFFDSMIFLEGTSRFNEEMRKIAAGTAKDIMTEEVLTVSGETSVSGAATMMIEKGVYHLPVVENGKPLGVVRKDGLLKAFIAEHEVR